MAKRPTNPAANDTALAVVDTIEDDDGRVTVVPNDGRVHVRGWALDAGAEPFAAVDVEVGGARASGPCAHARPDVAALFGGSQWAGFDVELALDDAAPGHHLVTIRGERADGSRVPIALATSLDVVPPLRRLPVGVAAGTLVGFVDEVGIEAGSAADGMAPLVVPAGRVVVVRGWAASPDGIPATLAYAEIDGARAVRGMTGYPRPDVAAELRSSAVDYGFRFRIEADEIGAGEHALRVHAIVGNTIAAVGHEVRISVVAREAPRVFQAEPRVRGRIDLVGRLDRDAAIVEERSYLRLAAHDRAVVTGWAGDPVAELLPSRVMLVVDGVAHGPVQRGIERDDVADATACERMRTSGFSAVVRADALGAGFHHAEMLALYDAEPVVFDAFSFEVIA
ncbi:MAG TPA: hypothetical protein VGU66_20420 [Candidatus Elarobacter sp.]|nr:hypothetical protein [Candidatus Elarobacter sp.]